MRILLFLLLASLQAYSQKKVPEGPPSDFDHHCFYKKKYSDSARMKFYPFNKAASIKLVSFRYQSYYSPITKDSVNVDSLVEVKDLSGTDINLVTDILYNNFYKKRRNIGEMPQCWQPRNAILFYDNSGKILETIEICFHCEYHHSSSKKVVWGDECYEKIEKLRKYFIKQGMVFGTDLSVNEYPGESIRDRRVAIPPLKE